MDTPQRLYHIDWIRILAFLLLIMFHASLPFTVFPWEVKDQDQSAALSSVIWWLHQWRLPLLFFISGAGIHFSLQRRTMVRFLGERMARLFLPLLFAMFFTIPVQVYVEFLQKGRFEGSYLDFYPAVWKMVPYPDGALTWSHMWFVVYLIAFLLLLSPIWVFFRWKRMQPVKAMISSFLTRPLCTAAMVLPLFFLQYTFSLRYPETGSLIGDWFVFFFSMTVLLYGYFLGGNPRFWQFCESQRRNLLLISITVTAALFAGYWWPLRLPEQQDERFLLYCALNAVCIWSTILSVCGFAAKYLNRDSRLRRYLNEAVFPFYIIHQTVIVAIGYGIVQTGLPAWIKLPALATLSFAVILVLYHGIIRRTSITRLLFGMKQRAQVQQNDRPAR
jgi:surface polysaccharide O-acyltransferase-like enzyme